MQRGREVTVILTVSTILPINSKWTSLVNERRKGKRSQWSFHLASFKGRQQAFSQIWPVSGLIIWLLFISHQIVGKSKLTLCIQHHWVWVLLQSHIKSSKCDNREVGIKRCCFSLTVWCNLPLACCTYFVLPEGISKLDSSEPSLYRKKKENKLFRARRERPWW